jgi:hypothetical protein
MRAIAIVAIVVGVTLPVAGGGSELLWRLDHPIAEPGAWSQSNSQVAEVRFMPEGSPTPYGIGVFIRSKLAVLRGVQSELAFAGYCRSITTSWASDQDLNIQCELLEGEPFTPRPVVRGVKVQAVVLREQAPNPSIERDVQGLSPLAAPHVKR